MIPSSNPKKRQRVPHNHRHSSTTTATTSTRVSSTAAIIDSLPDQTLSEASQKLRRTSSHPTLSSSATSSAAAISFNDPTTADVILRLYPDTTTSPTPSNDVQIYLHTAVLRRAKYFSALLSDRWQHTTMAATTDSAAKSLISLNFAAPPSAGAVEIHLTVLELLYTSDFSAAVSSVAAAIDILPVALELLFEDLVANCLKFLEAVPWTEEEEQKILNLIPLLNKEESNLLLSRVSPPKIDTCEEMLQGLITAAIHNHPNMAFVKAFVAKLIREFSSREAAARVLEREFLVSLKVVKESLEEYSSPDFRGGDHNETEAIQRLNLHTAMTNGRHLLWLVERMIELRVADSAVREWSEQENLAGDLQRALRDDAWRNIVPGLPSVMIRCTSRLANAVAVGTILASRQVRMKLVKDWLPVLLVCKDNVSPMMPTHRAMYLELEETFLRIISTLPMSDAQELLQQCLSFSTRNVDDCTHLVTAFNTWFRRASRFPQGDNLC